MKLQASPGLKMFWRLLTLSISLFIVVKGVFSPEGSGDDDDSGCKGLVPAPSLLLCSIRGFFFSKVGHFIKKIKMIVIEMNNPSH